MTLKPSFTVAFATLLCLSAAPAVAQQPTNTAMRAKCQAQVRKVLPNYNDVSQKAQAVRLFNTCMSNGGKL